LYEESGLTLEEIATITAVGMETAKSRLRYAVMKLRHALSAASEQGSESEQRATSAMGAATEHAVVAGNVIGEQGL
jgi:hypothetical protein